jgi:hypothetical protein
MKLENSTVLQNLKERKTEIEVEIGKINEMYLKVCGAIEVLDQIENSTEEDTVETQTEEETKETEVVQ